ncbi:MAG: hypothetical protein ACYC6B_03535 [Thermoleophilia bacterium]
MAEDNKHKKAHREHPLEERGHHHVKHGNKHEQDKNHGDTPAYREKCICDSARMGMILAGLVIGLFLGASAVLVMMSRGNRFVHEVGGAGHRALEELRSESITDAGLLINKLKNLVREAEEIL